MYLPRKLCESRQGSQGGPDLFVEHLVGFAVLGELCLLRRTSRAGSPRGDSTTVEAMLVSVVLSNLRVLAR